MHLVSIRGHFYNGRSGELLHNIRSKAKQPVDETSSAKTIIEERLVTTRYFKKNMPPTEPMHTESAHAGAMSSIARLYLRYNGHGG